MKRLLLPVLWLMLMALPAPSQSIRFSESGKTVVLKVAANGQDLKASCVPENNGYALAQMGADIVLVFEPPAEGLYIFALALNDAGKTAVAQWPVQVGSVQGLAKVKPVPPVPPVPVPPDPVVPVPPVVPDPFAKQLKKPPPARPAEPKPADPKVLDPFGKGDGVGAVQPVLRGRVSSNGESMELWEKDGRLYTVPAPPAAGTAVVIGHPVEGQR